ncbi:MAG: cadherin-like beta sandwich domain-containing protein, partial [Microbacteriaceae bacterium]
GVASHDAPSVEVSTSDQAASIHIKLIPAPQDAEAQLYHIQISETPDFAGMAWTHTTTEREFDVALVANHTYYVRESAHERIGDTNQYVRVGAWGSGSAVAQVGSDEARLGSLALEEGIDLNAEFASDVLEYTANVGTAKEFLSVSALAILKAAQVTIQGNTVTADSPSTVIPLSYGENLIGIKSVSPDNSKSVTYLLTVTRAYPKGWTERTTEEASPVVTTTDATDNKPVVETVNTDPIVEPTAENIAASFANILTSVTGDLSNAESEVQVSGLQPESAFTVTMHSDPVVLFEGSADANGSLNVNLDWAKADCTPGEHHIEVAFVAADGTNQTSSIAAEISDGCTVGAVAPAVYKSSEAEQTTGGTDEPDVMAQSGSAETTDFSGWIIGGIALVVLAGLGLFVARRRRA